MIFYPPESMEKYIGKGGQIGHVDKKVCFFIDRVNAIIKVCYIGIKIMSLR